MTGSVPLIVSEEPVDRGLLAKMKTSRPNVAVVYSDGFGQVACFDGRPLRRSQQIGSPYRTRYEVDLSDHRRVARLESSPLPARGDMYFFHAMVDVGFKVTDAAEVVRRHVTDALAVVYNFLIGISRPVTRCHDIQDAQGAEEQINARFAMPVILPEGITIYRCMIRLLPDGAAQNYLRSREVVNRDLTLIPAEQQLAVARALNEAELAALAQRARLAREDQELRAAAGRPLDIAGLLREHLIRHPEDTAYATQLLMSYQQALSAREDIGDQRTAELFKYMVDNGLIQSVDVDGLRAQMLGRVQGIAAAGPPELPSAGESWDEPLPGHAAARPHPPAGQQHRVIPVYMIIDESVADDGYFTALNEGMRVLPAHLAGDADIMSAVRLAVIGYGNEIDVRLPLTAVGPDSIVPALSHRDGTGLPSALDYLRTRIPEDVGLLKSQNLIPGRPTVYLLSGAEPSPGWEAAHQQLTDRQAFPYAPNIIACGIAAADPVTVSRMASPSQFCWAATPSVPAHEAIRSYLEFIQASIVSLCHAYLSGSAPSEISGPAGFRRAGEGD